jgi:hypothetical protein
VTAFNPASRKRGKIIGLSVNKYEENQTFGMLQNRIGRGNWKVFDAETR